MLEANKDKNKFKIFSFFFIIFFLIGIAAFCAFFYFFHKDVLSYVYVGEKRVELKLEKAESRQERYDGLSERKELCSNCGMIFIMPREGIYNFSMRRMNFNLDFIWIKNNQIVEITKNVSKNFPGKINSKVSVDKVIEVPGGFIEENKLKVGDPIVFE